MVKKWKYPKRQAIVLTGNHHIIYIFTLRPAHLLFFLFLLLFIVAIVITTALIIADLNT